MDEIIIKSTLNQNRIMSTLTVPKHLRKYFNFFNFFATYDTPILADKSIISIPLISNVLPLAWLVGADVRVETLDKNYSKAMNAIKNEFNLIFPRGRFKTKIVADKLVDNQTNSTGTALLFTGGIDSIYSMIDNIKLKPRLLMYSGIQHYQLFPNYSERERFVRDKYAAFAAQKGLEFNFIKTNIIGVLNDNRIAHDFHRILRGTNLWLGLQFPLVLLGLPAPLSIGRFNKILISASVDPSHNYTLFPHSSQPRIDEKFSLADLKVEHYGYIHRFSKTSLIKEYLKNNALEINVCNRPPPNKLNCSACEKCYRTIASLVLEGVDPNKCGFEVDNSTFRSIKRMLIKKNTDALAVDSLWKKLQLIVPDRINTDFYGSKDFFQWFKRIDINAVRKKRNTYWAIYNTLPFPLALLYDAIIYSALKKQFKQLNRSVNPVLSFIALIRFYIEELKVG